MQQVFILCYTLAIYLKELHNKKTNKFASNYIYINCKYLTKETKSINACTY